MPTPREIRESNEREALVEAFRGTDYGHLLDEHEPELLDNGYVKVGEYEVRPGQKPDKPVIVRSDTKRMVRGSGRSPKANDPVLLGKETGYRQTKEYRDARQRFDELLPLEGDPDVRGTLAWAYEQFWLAAQGSPQYVDCQHEGCSKKHLVAFKKDPNAMFKVLEMRIGKAPQTVNINSKEEVLVKALEYRAVDIRVQGLGFEDVDSRRSMIEGFGYTLDDPTLEAASTASLPAGDEAAPSPA